MRHMSKEVEELSELYAQQKDAYYQQQDEMARLLWEKDHTIREREFQMNLQRQEMQLLIDLAEQENLKLQSENKRLQTALEELTLKQTEGVAEEANDESNNISVSHESIDESDIVQEVTVNEVQPVKIDDQESWSCKNLLHQCLLVVWSGCILAVLLIAFNKSF